MPTLFENIFLLDDDTDLFEIDGGNIFSFVDEDEEEILDTSNPFIGLITPAFKKLHKDMIDALLDDTGLTQRVKFVYNKYEQCDNCIYDQGNGKSSNTYNGSGPKSFRNGQICPQCNGKGKHVVSAQEYLYLMVVWDSKGWAKMAANSETLRVPEMMIQTKCKMLLKPKIMKVSYIEITDIEGYGTLRFERHGDPEPCGFNDNNFLHTMWKRIK